MMADIEAMFHQVYVTPRNRDALRFLWWPKRRHEQGCIRVQDDSLLIQWKLDPKLVQFHSQAHGSREQRFVQLGCRSTSDLKFLRRRLLNVCEERRRCDNNSSGRCEVTGPTKIKLLVYQLNSSLFDQPSFTAETQGQCQQQMKSERLQQ